MQPLRDRAVQVLSCALEVLETTEEAAEEAQPSLNRRHRKQLAGFEGEATAVDPTPTATLGPSILTQGGPLLGAGASAAGGCRPFWVWRCPSTCV